MCTKPLLIFNIVFLSINNVYTYNPLDITPSQCRKWPFNATDIEMNALMDLFNSTNGQYWNQPWKLSLAACKWKGVCCSNTSVNASVFNVISLDLSNNNLSGSISYTIANIQYLQTIDFQNNKLIGTLPSTISSFKNLSYLNLGKNMLTGNISSIKCNGTNLQNNLTLLVLSRNNFIANNSLELLTHCKSLQLLYLSNNKFGGQIPVNISNISDLQYLDLSTNWFGGLPTGLTNLTALKLLSLSNMTLSANLTLMLPPLKHLEYLSLYNAPNMFGDVNNFICNAVNISVLQIADTKVQGYIPPCLAHLTKLKVLDLSRNLINGTLPNIYNNGSTVLTTLNIGRNKISGTIPKSYCSKKIEVLIIDHNYFSAVPNCLYIDYNGTAHRFSGLKYLDISHNRIKSSKQLNLSMSNLTYAFLHKNEFSGSLPLFKQHRSHLEKVTIHDNDFQDAKISQWLSKLFAPDISPVLNILSVYNNSKLKGTIPIITENSSITAFFAHRCYFTGQLTTPITNNYTGPKHLINITLYYNSISGKVPKYYLSPQLLNKRKKEKLKQTIIVITGNRFQSVDKNIFNILKLWFNNGDTLPSWVDPMETNSPALYITAFDYLEERGVFTIAILLLIMLIIRHFYNSIQHKRGGSIFMSGLLEEQKLLNIKRHHAKNRFVNVNNRNNENVIDIDRRSVVEFETQLKHPFFAKLSTVANILGSKIAIIYVIVMAVLYKIWSTLYTDGNFLAHWSIAYFESTHINFLMILLMAIVYNISIAYLFYYLYFKFEEIDIESIPSPSPRTTSISFDISPKESTKTSVCCKEILSKLYSLMLILLWLLTLFCVFIYFLFATLPNDNNLGISSSWLPLSHYSMAAILSFNNIFIVPSVADTWKSIVITVYTRFCCCCSAKVNSFDYKIRSFAIISLRSVTNILLPIVCSIFLLNECGGYWILFWQGCYPSIGKYSPQPYFNVSNSTQYYNKFRIKYHFDNYTYPINKNIPVPSIHHYINREIEILSSKDICSYGFGTNLESGEYCMRDFFEYWGTTILFKFVCNLFMPFLIMFRYWIVFKYCGRKNGFWKFAKKHFRPDSSYASIISYLEIVIIFGFVIPLLIPLCAVAFLINFCVYTRMAKFGRRMPDRKSFFPIWILFAPIIFSQIELILFFFVTQENHGYICFIILSVIAPLVDFILIMKWCSRKKEFQLLNINVNNVYTSVSRLSFSELDPSLAGCPQTVQN